MTTKVDDKDFKSIDKVMLKFNTTYKYDTSFNGPFAISQCVEQWNGHIKILYNKN